MILIDSSKVSEIFIDCLYKNSELNENKKPVIDPIIIKAITFTAAFHPERVIKHKKEIIEMLNNLPENFIEGQSFLNICMDKNNNLWTGSHKICEELMILGMAIGKINYCMEDREFWTYMPGGVPYLYIIS